jgi:hypothetical protein
MKNKLFFIFPLSNMKTFIRKIFGDNVYFLTSLGSVFQFDNINYLESIGDFMSHNEINEIHIVNDTSCHFLKKILLKEKRSGTYTEAILEELYVNNYYDITLNEELKEQQIKLAELNVTRQIGKVFNNQFLLNKIIGHGIEVNGIITTKKRHEIVSIMNQKVNEF